MTKRILALLLALMMVVCVLAACSGDTKPNNDDTNKPNSGDDKQGDDGNEPSGEVPTLNVWLYDTGNSPLFNGSEAEAQANEICEREIGCRFKVTWITNSEYVEKVSTALASKEQIDVLWNAFWVALSHKDLVEQGALLPLTEYLVEGGIMGDAATQSGDLFIEGGTINGECYGLASVQRNYRYTGVYFNKNLADEWGIKDQIDAIDSMWDIMDIMDSVKDKAPDGMCMFYNSGQPTHGWDITVDSTTGYIKEYSYMPYVEYSLVLDDDMKTVVMLPENEYNYNAYRWIYEMAHKGYQWPKAEIDNTVAASLGPNNLLFAGEYKWAPGYDKSVEQAYNMPVYVKELGIVWSESDEFSNAQLGVCFTTQNKELAAKWINLLYANKDFYNTMLWGKEGVDYTLDAEGRVVYDQANSYYTQSWTLANNYNGLVEEIMPADYWAQVAKVNDAMEPMYLQGFSWSTTGNDEMETIRNATNAVTNEYFKYGNGTLLNTTELSYDDLIKEYHDAYYSAGGEQLIAYIQTAVDEFIQNYR